MPPGKRRFAGGCRSWSRVRLRRFRGRRYARSSSGARVARRVRFHPQADQEAEGAVQWYRERSPMAAAGFVAELSPPIQQVAETPERWPRYIANKAVYLSRLSLQPYLPFD